MEPSCSSQPELDPSWRYLNLDPSTFRILGVTSSSRQTPHAVAVTHQGLLGSGELARSEISQNTACCSSSPSLGLCPRCFCSGHCGCCQRRNGPWSAPLSLPSFRWSSFSKEHSWLNQQRPSLCASF